MSLRIREILDERGIGVGEFADEVGFNQGQVSRWLNGTRRTNTDFLEAAAAYLRLPVGALFRRPRVPLVGYIGAGSEAHFFDSYTQGDGLDEIEIPIDVPNTAVAVTVRGTSMFPAYMDGDVIVYSDQRRDIDTFLRRRVICRLEDGRTMIKVVTPGAQHGLYTLISFNAEPIEDVALEWVAVMDCVIPR